MQYGAVVTWGIPIDLHSEVVFNLAGEFLEDPKDYGAIQADSMCVQVAHGAVKPTIRNDTMRLHHALFGAHPSLSLTVFYIIYGCYVCLHARFRCTGRSAMPEIPPGLLRCMHAFLPPLGL